MPQPATARTASIRYNLGASPDAQSPAAAQDFARRTVRAFSHRAEGIAQWRGLTIRFIAVDPVTPDQIDALLPPLAIRCAALLTPQHLHALVAADPAIAALLVERCYGGTPAHGRSASKRRAAAGHAERHECAGFVDLVLGACTDAADPLAAFTAARIAGLDDGDATLQLDGGQPLIHLAFTLHIPADDAAYAVSLILPAALFKGAGGPPPATTPDSAAQQRWRRHLRQRSGDVALPVRSVIARPTLSLAQVMALRPGDVIPIQCPRNVPLLVADRHFASGTIGERDGRVAFCISHLEPEQPA